MSQDRHDDPAKRALRGVLGDRGVRSDRLLHVRQRLQERHIQDHVLHEQGCVLRISVLLRVPWHRAV